MDDMPKKVPNFKGSTKTFWDWGDDLYHHNNHFSGHCIFVYLGLIYEMIMIYAIIYMAKPVLA